MRNINWNINVACLITYKNRNTSDVFPKVYQQSVVIIWSDSQRDRYTDGFKGNF